ncbi:hypothetical protein EXIGLDRAFT_725259, partial [Exidia glandulosa HHB12029]
MGVGVQGMPTLAASAVLQSSSQQGLKHYQSMAVRMRSTKEVEPCIVDLSRWPSVHSRSTISISVRRRPF